MVEEQGGRRTDPRDVAERECVRLRRAAEHAEAVERKCAELGVTINSLTEALEGAHERHIAQHAEIERLQQSNALMARDRDAWHELAEKHGLDAALLRVQLADARLAVERAESDVARLSAPPANPYDEPW